MDLNKSRPRDWKKNPPRASSLAALVLVPFLGWVLWVSRKYTMSDSMPAASDALLIVGMIAAGLFILAYIRKAIAP